MIISDRRMSMSEKIITMPTSLGPKEHWLSRVLSNFRDWNMRRRAKIELQSLPTHLLNDIGVSRELIDDYVDGVMVRRNTTATNVVELGRSGSVAVETKRAKAA
jgi:uncharacterized protein YjiS (DUF1127 family)